jgi:Fe-S-cluster containining protein
MTSRDTRRHLPCELAAAANAYQVASVIPHCPECSRPCCRLDPLVLELEWKQLKSFWRLEESRPAFDRRLASGKGPEEIRAGNGLYYVHGKPCPVYDEAGRSCRVYGQELKPLGCSDFPVYENEGAVIADLRCEAVDRDALATWIAHAVGQGFRVVQSADEEFPFMVTLSVKKLKVRGEDSSKPAEKKRRR